MGTPNSPSSVSHVVANGVVSRQQGTRVLRFIASILEARFHVLPTSVLNLVIVALATALERVIKAEPVARLVHHQLLKHGLCQAVRGNDDSVTGQGKLQAPALCGCVKEGPREVGEAVCSQVRGDQEHVERVRSAATVGADQGRGDVSPYPESVLAANFVDVFIGERAELEADAAVFGIGCLDGSGFILQRGESSVSLFLGQCFKEGVRMLEFNLEETPVISVPDEDNVDGDADRLFFLKHGGVLVHGL